jgi:formiminotetrahydrofolate cyclodeaminase
MYDKSTTIEAFLKAAGARQPTPGGGSVAALVGALAASMAEMATNYSVGKKGLEQHQPQLAAALAEFAKARDMLATLMAEDQEAYEALTAARKQSPGAARDAAVAAAVLTCILVPQNIGAIAAAVLDLCNQLADVVNPYLLSDLAVAADLAMATVRCAIYNIKVNLPDVTDPAQRHRVEAESSHLFEVALRAVQSASKRIWQRLERPR